MEEKETNLKVITLMTLPNGATLVAHYYTDYYDRPDEDPETGEYKETPTEYKTVDILLRHADGKEEDLALFDWEELYGLRCFAKDDIPDRDKTFFETYDF